MKFLTLTAFFFVFQCCTPNRQSVQINTFNDKWGVCFYISPRYVQDGCSYRAFFFPFQSAGDTSLIYRKSSPFDFSYAPGIRFYTYNSTFLRQVYYTNALPRNIHQIQDNNHIIHWAFMKLLFKTNPGYSLLTIDATRTDTIISSDNILKVQYYNFDRFIEVEKIKESNPDIHMSTDSIKLLLSLKKHKMPC